VADPQMFDAVHRPIGMCHQCIHPCTDFLLKTLVHI